MNFDRNLFQAAKQEWLALTATILAGLVGGIAVIFQARQLSRILSRVFIDGSSRAEILPLFAPLLAILASRAVFIWLSDFSAGTLAIRIKTGLRRQLSRKIFALGPAYVRGENSAELANTALQGIESLDAYFSQYLPQIPLAALIPLAILAVVFPTDWISGLIMLLTAPLIPVFMMLIGQASEAATRRQWKALGHLSTYFLDTLQGLQELKQLGQSEARAARVFEATDQYREATMKVLRVTFLSALVLELVGTISTAVIAVGIGLRLLYGRLAFEQAFFILLLAPEFYLPLRQLGQRFHAGASGIQAARRIFTILQTPEPAEPASQHIEPAEIEAVRSIVFDQVSFTYPGRSAPALSKVAFSVRHGEMTAIVGATGAGKTTMIHLLLRFISPDEGQIRVNGIPLATIPLNVWRRRIAWVPQQPVLFQGTIGENLCLGKPDAAEEEIKRAAHFAQLDGLVSTLPLGYDTPIGEGGARLSGGEIQRVALARAFLMNPEVLVLDEPSAHLDPQTETWLEESLQQLRAGRMIFVIAHRLPTVYKADQILVMDHGQIVEYGTHPELIQAGGYYARLLRSYSGAPG